MFDGHGMWQWLSHTWYVWISVIGSLIVLGIVYWNRNKRGWYKRARDK